MSAKRHLFIVLLLLLTHNVHAEERPHWYFEVKGGNFESEEEQWSDFYGSDSFPAYAVALGYQLRPQIEVGVEAGYLEDEGRGFAPAHGVLAGTVKYRLYPVHLGLTLRGIFHPDQWLVPYLGAAWSRFSYQVETEAQSDISGATDGYQYRAGFQFLLDRLEKSASSGLRDFGIDNTYLFLEMQRTDATLDGAQLGGTASLGGFRFEF